MVGGGITHVLITFSSEYLLGLDLIGLLIFKMLIVL